MISRREFIKGLMAISMLSTINPSNLLAGNEIIHYEESQWIHPENQAVRIKHLIVSRYHKVDGQSKGGYVATIFVSYKEVPFREEVSKEIYDTKKRMALMALYDEIEKNEKLDKRFDLVKG